jgi:hypothetical protein
MQTLATWVAITFFAWGLISLLRSPNRNAYSNFYSILCIVVFVAGVSTACGSNPMGSTTRERLRTDAQVEIAKAQERAAIGVAEAQAGAVVAKHSMWADVLPTALVIIVGGVLGALYINWAGRHAMARLQSAPQPTGTPRAAQLPTLGQLHRLAERQGYTLEIEGNTAYLVDSQGKRYRQKALMG